MSDLIEGLQRGRADGTYPHRLKSYLAPDVLVIDELGFKPLPVNITHDFFDVIAKRYEQQSIIITSNKLFEEWDAVFSDSNITKCLTRRPSSFSRYYH